MWWGLIVFYISNGVLEGDKQMLKMYAVFNL